MSEPNYDRIVKLSCAFVSLLVNVTFLYVIINSILIPIFLAGIPISLFSCFCLLTVVESFFFIILFPPSAKAEIKKIISESINESNTQKALQYVSFNAIYYCVKLFLDIIHLLLIVILALIV